MSSPENTILIVDDEEMIRELVSDIIESLGYDSVTAEDGIDALKILDSRQDIGVVILDMNMPNMSGPECYKEIRIRSSNLDVILSSGMDQEETENHFESDEKLHFIQKPYTLMKMASLIQSIVEK